MKKKMVVLTGAGVSAESGFRTFRDSGGLWEQYPVERVASHEGWLRDPNFVNEFYNGLREQLFTAQPNRAHELLAEMEADLDVRIVTQNVDDLHERAGSTRVLHLHGELLRACSSRDVEDPRCWRTLTREDYVVTPNERAADGSLLRPYIVFFGEAVPRMDEAVALTAEADVFVVVGSSLAVYPAAGLLSYVRPETPIYVVDPAEVSVPGGKAVHHICARATEGVEQLRRLLRL